MRIRKWWFALLVIASVLLGTPFAWADTLYENGPVNGETDGWTINFGFVISDSFTISTGPSQVNGLSFWAWITPGDTVTSVEVKLTSQPLSGTVYFDGMVNLTQSNCFLNSYSYDVCQLTGTFTPTNLINGTYWLQLQNAEDTLGDPVYWDENAGVDCHSPGCPSEGINNSLGGTLPSEAFTILGTREGGGTVPEPATLMLLASGVLAAGGAVRRYLR